MLAAIEDDSKRRAVLIADTFLTLTHFFLSQFHQLSCSSAPFIRQHIIMCSFCHMAYLHRPYSNVIIIPKQRGFLLEVVFIPTYTHPALYMSNPVIFENDYCFFFFLIIVKQLPIFNKLYLLSELKGIFHIYLGL